MTKNSDELTLGELLPTDRIDLLNEKSKIGGITFTAPEKKLLENTIGTPGWKLIKGIYVKQRLVQIAVATVTMAQNSDELHRYKGKANEVDQLIKEIEFQVASLKNEDNDN